MKNLLKIAAFIFASTVTGLSAMAQTECTRVAIPFAFQVDGKLLPAGTYTIASQLDKPVAAISRWETKVNLQTGGMHDAYSQTKPHTVVFDRVGSQYFLREIVVGASSSSLVLPQSKAEKQAKQRNDVAGLAPETPVVLATY